MSFGCCNDFEKCSDLARCIHEGDSLYKDCMYRENLDKGLNFYTEYNEHNEARAEEYARSKLKQKYEGLFVEIPNRIFYIGKREKYRGWTYRLELEGTKEIIEKLNIYSVFATITPDKEKFKDEPVNNEQSGNVIVKLDEVEYNIKNYNCRALKLSTMKKIASYLVKKGLDAEVEIQLNFSRNSKILKMNKTSSVKKSMIQEDKQLSILEMIG